MTPLESYFDRIYCLTLRRRKDRRASAEAVFEYLDIPSSSIEWVFGPDRPLDHTGKPNGNQGCTAGHRMILDDIIKEGVPRALVFEDDIAIAYDSPEMKHLLEPQSLFEQYVNEVPADWDMLYLGGQYADNPQRRVAEHVIRFNRMLTTSSYGVTLDMARRMAPNISGVGPIDSLYGGFQPEGNCYVFSPRLFTQSRSYSDLTDRIDDNRPCMLDSRHEEMLIAGAWRTSLDGKRLFDSEINRREIAGPNDLNGQEVIVDGELFIVESLKLPPHPSPWRRGESITYTLTKPAK
jgi:glycosyl transferase family 25